MPTKTDRGRISAKEAASALEDPHSLSAVVPDDSPPERGWMAGRLIDGFELAVDGKPPEWYPPRWLRALEAQGYERSVDGEAVFVVTHISDGELRRFGTVRDALRYGRARILRRRMPVHPDSISIDCRTATGLTVPVVWGRALLGMAGGALDAEPIRSLGAPAE
ncbi:MAG: hypothetical protein HW391_1141 [Chloroflexi bacterium]|nr:hypothetical protein [Chloroflexota bacterium]